MSINNNDENADSASSTETPRVLPTQREPNHLLRAVVIWAVLSVIGIAVVIPLGAIFLPAGASALETSDNFSIILLTALAIPVAFFVFVFLGYSMIVFRVKE